MTTVLTPCAEPNSVMVHGDQTGLRMVKKAIGRRGRCLPSHVSKVRKSGLLLWWAKPLSDYSGHGVLGGVVVCAVHEIPPRNPTRQRQHCRGGNATASGPRKPISSRCIGRIPLQGRRQKLALPELDPTDPTPNHGEITAASPCGIRLWRITGPIRSVTEPPGGIFVVTRRLPGPWYRCRHPAGNPAPSAH